MSDDKSKRRGDMRGHPPNSTRKRKLLDSPEEENDRSSAASTPVVSSSDKECIVAESSSLHPSKASPSVSHDSEKLVPPTKMMHTLSERFTSSSASPPVSTSMPLMATSELSSNGKESIAASSNDLRPNKDLSSVSQVSKKQVAPERMIGEFSKMPTSSSGFPLVLALLPLIARSELSSDDKSLKMRIFNHGNAKKAMACSSFSTSVKSKRSAEHVPETPLLSTDDVSLNEVANTASSAVLSKEKSFDIALKKAQNKKLISKIKNNREAIKKLKKKKTKIDEKKTKIDEKKTKLDKKKTEIDEELAQLQTEVDEWVDSQLYLL